MANTEIDNTEIDNWLKKTIDYQSMIIDRQSIVYFQSIGNRYSIFYKTSNAISNDNWSMDYCRLPIDW